MQQPMKQVSVKINNGGTLVLIDCTFFLNKEDILFPPNRYAKIDAKDYIQCWQSTSSKQAYLLGHGQTLEHRYQLNV